MDKKSQPHGDSLSIKTQAQAVAIAKIKWVFKVNLVVNPLLEKINIHYS